MARKYAKRGGARKPKIGRRRRYAKRGAFKGKGHMALKRQTRPFVIKNTAVAGVAAVTGYSGGVAPLIVQLGSPEQDTNFSQNIWNVPFACQFQASDILGASEITALFDQYKITGVKLKLKYNGNTFDGSNSTGRAQNQPVLKYSMDYDDASPPVVTTFNERMDIKQVAFNENRYCNLWVRPKPVSAVLDSVTGISQPVLVGKAGWINCSNMNITHYGIKGYIEGMPLGTSASLSSVVQIEATYYIKLRGVQ